VAAAVPTPAIAGGRPAAARPRSAPAPVRRPAVREPALAGEGDWQEF
jgi:hypothetical protein